MKNIFKCRNVQILLEFLAHIHTDPHQFQNHTENISYLFKLFLWNCFLFLKSIFVWFFGFVTNCFAGFFQFWNGRKNRLPIFKMCQKIDFQFLKMVKNKNHWNFWKWPQFLSGKSNIALHKRQKLLKKIKKTLKFQC